MDRGADRDSAFPVPAFFIGGNASSSFTIPSALIWQQGGCRYSSREPKQVHAFCDHAELLIRARVYDAQTFTLLTDPQSIMGIGLRFMTSKVMERVPEGGLGGLPHP